MKAGRWMMALLAGAVVAVGCTDDDVDFGAGDADVGDASAADGGGPDGTTSDSGRVDGSASDTGSGADGAGDAADGAPATMEFTAFVTDLINKETRDNNPPTDTENRTFTDAEDPNAFPPSFFP